MTLLSRLKKSKIGSSIRYSIKPRKVKFEWQDTPVDWIPNQPFVSYFVNEINMILPAGEFWFCRLYNKVLPKITDEKLAEDVKAFIRQEAMHAQAHNSANKEYLTLHNIDVSRNLKVMDYLFGTMLADQPMGFCLFGNAAIAAKYALDVRGLDRVAVLDFDVHHGNGTEAIFLDDPDVLTLSLHQDRNYPLDTGGADIRGARASNINIPLPPGCGHASYLEAFERIVLPVLARHRPEIIIVACGYDASALDPLGRMLLSAESFGAMTRALRQAAADLCKGRLVLVHEGGYSEAYVPFCGHAAIAALEGDQQCVRDIAEQYKRRRDVLVKGLHEAGWMVEMPKASMYVWAKIPEQYAGMGSLEFAKKLLNEAKVCVSPGIGFGDYGDTHVRFALIENRDRTRQAIRGIKAMFRADGLLPTSAKSTSESTD